MFDSFFSICFLKYRVSYLSGLMCCRYRWIMLRCIYVVNMSFKCLLKYLLLFPNVFSKVMCPKSYPSPANSLCLPSSSITTTMYYSNVCNHNIIELRMSKLIALFERDICRHTSFSTLITICKNHLQSLYNTKLPLPKTHVSISFCSVFFLGFLLFV